MSVYKFEKIASCALCEYSFLDGFIGIISYIKFRCEKTGEDITDNVLEVNNHFHPDCPLEEGGK